MKVLDHEVILHNTGSIYPGVATQNTIFRLRSDCLGGMHGVMMKGRVPTIWNSLGLLLSV